MLIHGEPAVGKIASVKYVVKKALESKTQVLYIQVKEGKGTVSQSTVLDHASLYGKKKKLFS